MAGLAKKYIKQAGGINKKAWALQRKAKGRSKPKSNRKSTKKTKAKRSVKNTNFNFGGGLGKGIAVGVAAGVVNRFIPVNIAGADLIIAGIVMKDSTVQKIGAITLGRSLASSFTGLATGGSGNGGGGY